MALATMVAATASAMGRSDESRWMVDSNGWQRQVIVTGGRTVTGGGWQAAVTGNRDRSNSGQRCSL